MICPNSFSLSEMYRLLLVIHKQKPKQWRDIASEYGLDTSFMGGKNLSAIESYILTGVNELRKKGFIQPGTNTFTRFDPLRITIKGYFFMFGYPVMKFIIWGFTVGIVSLASIKTLFMR